MSRPEATLCRLGLDAHRAIPFIFRRLRCGNPRAFTLRVTNMRRESNIHSDISLEADRVENPLGPIYSFLPAHEGCRVSAVAEQVSRALAEDPSFSVLLAGFSVQDYFLWNPADSPRRIDGQTWGAFVFDSHGLEVLDASEVYPRQLPRVLDYARRHYRTVFADITRAKERQAVETLCASECIFIVSTSDRASLQMAREKRDWLQSLGLCDQCGLLLERVPGGLSAEIAEEITGLPMCSMVDRPEYIHRLANWLGSEESYSTEAAYATVH